MGLFGKKKKGEKIIALFDIGSASVGAGLAIVGRDAKPTIVYQTRTPIQFQENMEFERFVDITIAALSKATHTLITEGFRHLTFTKHGTRSIDSICVSFASPWYVSQVKVVEHTYDTPQEITRQHITDILQKEEAAFLNSKLSQYAEQTEEKPEIIDRRVIGITLNGYSVDAPYGKKATTCTVTMLLSAISERVHTQVAHVLDSAFHNTPVVYDTFGLIAFSTLRDLLHQTDSFLFCDVTGEVTDVGLVREGDLLRLGSFPEGKRDLVRAVIKKFATKPREAESALAQYAREEASSDETLKMEEVVYTHRNVWQKAFQELLTTFNEGYAVPHTVALMADSAVIPIFEGYITGLQHKGPIGVDQKIGVVLLNEAFFTPHIHKRGKIVVDPFIAIITLFYDKVARLGNPS